MRTVGDLIVTYRNHIKKRLTDIYRELSIKSVTPASTGQLLDH